MGKMCKNSPKQTCRMKCPTFSCPARYCGMRSGNCCDVTCILGQASQSTQEASKEFTRQKTCKNSPKQTCRMKCPTTFCPTGRCGMRSGKCCDVTCVNENKTKTANPADQIKPSTSNPTVGPSSDAAPKMSSDAAPKMFYPKMSSDAAPKMSSDAGSCTPKPGKKPWKAHCDKATSQAACTGTGTAAAPYCAWAPSVTHQPSTPSVARQSAGNTRQQAMSKLAKIASSKELRTRQQVLMELQGLVSKRLGEQHESTSEKIDSEILQGLSDEHKSASKQIDSEILQGLGQTQMNPHL